MASESKPEVTEDILVASGEELSDMIRGAYGAPGAGKSKVEVPIDDSPEPEVRFEETLTDESPAQRDGPRPRDLPPDVQAALGRINVLENEIQNLRGVTSRPRAPQIEMIEPIPGLPVKIPKDPNQRFVRLTQDQVKGMGFEPELAESFNILGNVFFHSIQDILTAGALEAFDFMQNQRMQAGMRTRMFFDAHPDLTEHGELVEIIEQRARTQERLHERMPVQQYDQVIAARVRSGIARMRNQTVDQYMAEHQSRVTRRPTMETPPSRAMSSSRTTRMPRGTGRPANAQQAELDAVLGI
jgi:hypothetical protein